MERRPPRWIWITALTLAATSASAADEAMSTPATPWIFGGNPSPVCGFPSTVALEGGGSRCTGSLVHPQIVVYAAHCGAGFTQAIFGSSYSDPNARRVSTQFCVTSPGFAGLGTGTDFAYCKLNTAVTDIPIVPILMGCETRALRPGKIITQVGFGNSETGTAVKRQVDVPLVAVTAGNEAHSGGNGKGVCPGDSGGPAFVRLTAEDGLPGTADGSWRVFGVASYLTAPQGANPNCGFASFHALMHRAVPWIESHSRIDITPCHDADGTWNPGPGCGSFPLNPDAGIGTVAQGCGPRLLTGASATCGPAANSDSVAPQVAIVRPAQAVVLRTPGRGQIVTLRVDISASDVGSGVAQVQLFSGNQGLEPADGDAPFAFDVRMRAGVFVLTAVATDLVGNSTRSAPLQVTVLDP